MYYLGIDPGKTGGFAVVDNDGELIAWRSFSSWRDSHDFIRAYKKDIRTCGIEKVQSMSAQGVKSVFTFGRNVGGWDCYLELMRIPHSLIPPNRWQKMFLGSFPKGQSKVRSVDFINRRYPYAKLKKSEHGISDAVCLALYALVLDKRLSNKP